MKRIFIFPTIEEAKAFILTEPRDPVFVGGVGMAEIAAATLRADDILTALGEHFTLSADPAPRGSAPAQLWQVDGGPATVGIIASVSHAFCAACDRTRLTADGQVRSCLFATEETDLRALLRGGADDDALATAWRTAMWSKAAGHGINDPDFIQPQRPMSAIGG